MKKFKLGKIKKRTVGIATALSVVVGLLTGVIQLGAYPMAFFTKSPKEKLMANVEGHWGNVARPGTPACTHNFHYTTDRVDGDDIITLSSDDWISTARVTGFSDVSVNTRTITPRESAGELWELRFDNDRLLQVDKDGVTTALVRCS